MQNFGTQVAAGVASHAVSNQPTHPSEVWPVQKYLEEIHIVIVELATWLKSQESTVPDVFRIESLYRSSLNLGPPLTLYHKPGREHIQIFFPVTALVDVSSPGLGTFIITFSGGKWAVIDFPDSSTYTINSGSASSDIVPVYIRYTNQAIY